MFKGTSPSGEPSHMLHAHLTPCKTRLQTWHTCAGGAAAQISKVAVRWTEPLARHAACPKPCKTGAPTALELLPLRSLKTHDGEPGQHANFAPYITRASVQQPLTAYASHAMHKLLHRQEA